MGQTIKPKEGVTHKLFGTSLVAEGEGEENPPANEGEGEEEKPASDEPKTIFIEQVVREKKMKFFRVPRLGSYLSVRLSYQSCFSEKAIEIAIADKLEYDKRKEEQEAERKAREEEGDAGHRSDDEEDAKKFEEIKEKDFLYSEMKYAVCIDTMGQDRSLSQEQINFAISIVKDYANTWQSTEKNELKKDIQLRIEASKKDREHLELEAQNTQMDEERYIEEMLHMRDDVETDEQREREAKVHKLEFSSSQITGLTIEPEEEEDNKSEKPKETKPPATKGKDKGKEDVKKKDDKGAKDAKDKGKKTDSKPEPKSVKQEPKHSEMSDEESRKPKRPTTPRLDEAN